MARGVEPPSAPGEVVAGVDLSGKVENPSVLCVLADGKVSLLERFNADDELVALLAKHQPSTVGIDAPLTPPLGATGTYAFRLADLRVRKAGLPIFPP
ncbi:MAG TPA: hypothetical protein VM889_11015, partial [Candidatus Thermoplasmatota archaeon]|nr:hypothetical protein [Candidatus Thermoplasmatota archaeon]